jgi:ubiquitin-protein ligase
VPSPYDANCTPSFETNAVWHGVLFIHKGILLHSTNIGAYAGGIFKFTVMFPPHYPSVPPKIRFTSEVYHPLITDHGDFSLRPMGKWNTEQMSTTNVLHFIKRSFKKVGLENLREIWCVNPDAFKLYLLASRSLTIRFRDRFDVFANQARQCAILSNSSAMLYDTPGHEDEDSAMRFNKITKDEYEDVMRISEEMWKKKQSSE